MNATSAKIQKPKGKAPVRLTSQLGLLTLGRKLSTLLYPCLNIAALLMPLNAGSAVAAQEPQFSELPGIAQPAPNLSRPERPAPSLVAASLSPTNPAASFVARSNAVPPASGTMGALAANATNAMDLLDDKHALAIGDHLSFRIEEDLEDPKPLVVTDSGDLEVPYLGRFPAENKTCKQLARELKAALEKEYYYQATVIIAVDQLAKSRGKVYLVGPVRVPGPQEIPSDEVLTLSKAIMRAGGFNDFADRHNVKVTRKARAGGPDKQIFVVDVGQIFDKGKVELDLLLEPNDLILIPERLVRF